MFRSDQRCCPGRVDIDHPLQVAEIHILVNCLDAFNLKINGYGPLNTSWSFIAFT